MHATPLVGNDAQRQTLEALASKIDETDITAEDDGTVIFEGYSTDGLSVGIIAADGKIDWVVGEVEIERAPVTLLDAQAEFAKRREDHRISRKHLEEARLRFIDDRSPANEQAFESAIEWNHFCFMQKQQTRKVVWRLMFGCRSCGAPAGVPCSHDGGCIDSDRSG